MDSSKKHVSSDQILPSRRKVLSRFGLGIGASLIILTWLFLSNSLSGPKVLPFFQGLDSVSGGSSPGSWHFSFSTSSSGNAIGAEQGQRMKEANASRVAQKEDFKRADGKAMALETTHLGNSSEEVKKANFNAGQERIQQKTREANGSVVAENGSSLRNSSTGSLLSEGKTIGKPMENSTYRISTVTGDHNVGNFSRNEEVSRLPVGEDRPGNANSTVNNSIEIPSSDSQLMKNPDGSYENCDIFDGKWVRDDSKPYYPAGSCPYIDRDFDCHLNGRPDDGYVKWKWQPNGCNIPSLNATDFLEKIRGKKLVFVGDSLNRNMWESLVCILRNSIRNKKRVYEISGRREFKKKGFYAFRFEDYNCSVDFVSAPFLVRESSFKDENGTLETLRLDLMDRTTSMYHDADIIIFNTGHWWTHEKTSKGENYYQEGNHVYPRLKVLEAYRKALSTWARWVDKNIDSGRTLVFFRGYSVTHFRGGPWNSGGQCHKETEPIFNENHLVKYPSKMRALDHVLLGMNTPVVYLNISRLTDYRKDGHPSIYRSQFKTLEEKVAAERYQDCSHWCLPGVPDTWNELLYVSLLKAGRGSQKN